MRERGEKGSGAKGEILRILSLVWEPGGKKGTGVRHRCTWEPYCRSSKPFQVGQREIVIPFQSIDGEHDNSVCDEGE